MFRSLFVKHGRIIKYLISGILATATNVGIFTLLTYTTNWPYLLNSVVAFLIAFGISFFLQKFWTFSNASTNAMHTQALFYFVTTLINLGLTLLLMYLFVGIIYSHGLDNIISLKPWKVISQIIVNGLVAFESFFIYRLIFKA